MNGASQTETQAPQSWPYFAADELRCQCGCGDAGMDPGFMKKLVALRERLDFPLLLTSAKRCPKHNQAVSNTGPNGPHTTGRAVDIQVYGWQAWELIRAAVKAAEFSGIGVSQKGPQERRFIHLDDLETSTRPWVWSY